MKTLRVELGDRSYPIWIGGGLMNSLAELLFDFLNGRSALLVTDSNVKELYAEQVLGQLARTEIPVGISVFPAGEGSKHFASIESICRDGVRAGLDRKSVFLALGGGVCGDMTGFSAAIYMRGTRFIQIPTTLLAMVDSSVGGKTGVDLPEGKNLIGAFFQPEAVVMDTDCLKTLPVRELSCGYAELLKTAVILDGALFDRLERNSSALMKLSDAGLVSEVVARCCELKAQVVGADEKEAGLRAILNYGHTFGHAVESVTGYSAIAHGEAVGIGMCVAARLAFLLGKIPGDIVHRQHAVLKAFGLPTAVPASCSPEALLHAMGSDKKNSGGKLKLILPESLGSAGIYSDVPVEKIRQAILETTGAIG